MKNRQKRSMFQLLVIILLIALACFTVATFFYGNRILFYVELGITVVALILTVISVLNTTRENRIILENVVNTMDVERKSNIVNFPFPSIFLSTDGHILWYNKPFKSEIINDKPFNEKIFTSVWQSDKKKNLFESSGLNLSYGDKMFTVYGVNSEKNVGTTLFLIEDTHLKNIEKEYKDSKLSVLQIVIDNYEEVFSGIKESDKAKVLGQIEGIFENFVSDNKAFFRRLHQDKYIALVEEKYMKQLVKKRFPILDEMREIRSPNQTRVTLSVGIGSEGVDIMDSDKYSTQAIDMVLGRGGDQVAIKNPEKYDFFGGVTSGVESSSKVKTRIMASALSKIIDECDSCVVMGHKMADMDCFGAAVGMATAIRRMGKNAFVAINKERNQITEMLEKLEDNGYDNLFIDPHKVLDKMGRNSLVIITDTHVKDMLESQAVYEKASNVVIIDHHRRMVGYIDDTVLFFHEPNASSASEMVAELIPYLEGAGDPEPIEAEALLAGVSLDTKSFTFKTGVRTFEAAAYLKRHGADTLAVKKLFSTSEETYNKKVQVVSNAKVYGKTAVATTTLTGADMSLVAPQAADELLTITNVSASFVLYKSSTGKVQISARSYGDVNVQVIMEALDGGGHLTMAGASLETSLEEAEKLLITAIDNYYKNLNKKEYKDMEFLDEEEEKALEQDKLEDLSDILSKN